MKPAKKVVVIDNDPSVLNLIASLLLEEGYEVFTSTTGKEGVELALEKTAHLIVTEMTLPDMDGIQLCYSVRTNEQLKNTSVIFVTNRYEEFAEVAALKAGASDYITKPVKTAVLKLRINKTLISKPTIPTNSSVIQKDDAVVFKDLLIDKESYVVYKGEKKIQLPRKEFELLFYLGKNPNKIITRKVLLNELWSGENIVSRTVDSHIRKLRKKIGEGYINTVIGIGYKLDY